MIRAARIGGASAVLLGALALACGGSERATTEAAGTTRAETLSQIRSYIDRTYYSDKEIEYSFAEPSGKEIDCIDFAAQRSVKAWLAQGIAIPEAPPMPVPAAGTAPANHASDLAFAGQLDVHGKARRCPGYSVPTTRPTVAQIEAAGGLSAFVKARASTPRPMGMQDPPGTENDCWLNPFPGNGTATSSVVGTANGNDYDHAVGIQNSGWAAGASGFFGAQVITPVYSPSTQSIIPASPAGLEHTDTQLWAQTGICESWYGTETSYGQPCAMDASCTPSTSPDCAVQSLETGSITDATGTRLFVYFTADGYKSGCYAGYGEACATCPAMPMMPSVPPAPDTPDAGTGRLPDSTDASMVAGPAQENTDCWVAWPGAPYTVNMPLAATGYGVPPSELQLTVWNGAGTQSPGWWVFVNGSLIGWYPGSTFDWPDKTPGPMVNGPATYLQAGGEVYNTWPNGVHTDTAMVSDNSAWTGYESAAYQRNVGYFDQSETFHDANLRYLTTGPASEGDDGIPGLCGLDAAGWTDASGSFRGYSIVAGNNPLAPPAGQLGKWGEYFYFGGGSRPTAHQVQVTFSSIALLGNPNDVETCSGPTNPAKITPPDVVTTCVPTVNADGSLSTATVSTPVLLGCENGVAGRAVVDCFGSGVVGDNHIGGGVTFFVTGDCTNLSDASGAGEVVEFPFSALENDGTQPAADTGLLPGGIAHVSSDAAFVCGSLSKQSVASCGSECAYDLLTVESVTVLAE